MRYDGICCGTCGWWMRLSEHDGVCHHTSCLVEADGALETMVEWWCENWASEDWVKAVLYHRRVEVAP